MIRSYIKLAWRVLRRNPFFTAVSLFGISFTLAVLMLMVSYLQNQFGANAPLSNAASLIYFNQLEQQEIYQDTVWQIDSSLVDGILQMDSTSSNVEKSNWTSRSGFDIDFLKKFFSKEKMTSAEKVSFMSYNSSYDIFHNNKKYNLITKHVDEYYFEIFDFRILQGRVFQQTDIEQGALNVVISDELAYKYFGLLENVVGKTMYIDNKDFHVIGIVAKANVNNIFIDSDIFFPISYLDPTIDSHGYFGGYTAVMVAKNQNIEATMEEIEKITKDIPFLDPSQQNEANFNRMKVLAYDHFHLNTLDFIYSEDPKESKGKFKWIVGMLLFLFCIVPLLNLVNLNMSRIMDRSSEIGVRKAFGAHASQILTQIVFENIILTALGGLIGLLLSLGVMKMINQYTWLDNLRLSFNLNVFIISLIIVVVFGII